MILGSKHLFQRKAAFQPSANGAAAKACFPMPFGYGLCFAVECDEMVAAIAGGVQCLLYWPSTPEAAMQGGDRDAYFSRPRREILRLAVAGYHALRGMDHWLCKSSFDGPAPVSAVGNNAAIYAGNPCPLYERPRFAIEGDCAVCSRVVCLLAQGGPAAVFRRVIAVIVNAIQRKTRQRISHICVERLKAIAPSITDGDASSTIVGKRVAAWIKAAVFHVQPRSVNFREALSVCSVHDFLLGSVYHRVARVSSFNIWTIDWNGGSAP